MGYDKFGNATPQPVSPGFDINGAERAPAAEAALEVNRTRPRPTEPFESSSQPGYWQRDTTAGYRQG